MAATIKSEDHPEYVPAHDDDDDESQEDISVKTFTENQCIIRAMQILEQRLQKTELFKAKSPADVKHFCSLKLALKEHEVFGILFLNSQHRLIKFDEMFRGTIDGATVYTREVVKEALAVNAAAVILTHNHPSGNPTPSEADRRVTSKLKSALSLFDIRVLDHVIVGGVQTYSMAENGDII